MDKNRRGFLKTVSGVATGAVIASTISDTAKATSLPKENIEVAITEIEVAPSYAFFGEGGGFPVPSKRHQKKVYRERLNDGSWSGWKDFNKEIYENGKTKATERWRHNNG